MFPLKFTELFLEIFFKPPMNFSPPSLNLNIDQKVDNKLEIGQLNIDDMTYFT